MTSETTTSGPDRRIIDLVVKSAAPVEGKYGPQWVMEVQFPWSDFTEKAWINRDDGQDPIMPGSYRSIVFRRGIKKPEKGEIDYNYFWGIAEFDTQASGPPWVRGGPSYSSSRGAGQARGPNQPSVSPQYQGIAALAPNAPLDKEVLIAWTAARHDAVALYGPIRDEAFEEAERTILNWTRRVFEGWWPSGPGPDGPEAPEGDVPPPAEASPQGVRLPPEPLADWGEPHQGAFVSEPHPADRPE